jgi:hypothetical protein
MIRRDDEDFKKDNYWDKRDPPYFLCRGKRLFPMLEAIIQGGWKTDVNATGGFSEDRQVCKHFAKGGFESRDGPPAVYIADRYNYQEQEPTLQPIKYDEEWFKQHPDVVRVCQTLPQYKRSMEEEISSAMCYPGEKEWVVMDKTFRPLNQKKETSFESGENFTYYNRGILNIFLSDQELEHMKLGYASHYRDLIGVEKGMNEAKEILKKFIPKDLPVEYVNLYYCDGYNAFYTKAEKEESQCLLYNSFKPEGPPMAEGLNKDNAYKKWG